jgi:hypothetical protein
MWTACRNDFKNNLSYGLRIAPNETHARDSTSVLIESGSNDNEFTGNDCTHGGDGIFHPRAQPMGQHSNIFRNNDASYATTIASGSWSPGSTWLRNK